MIDPAGVAGASTFVGFVQGLSGSGSRGVGVAAGPGAAAITTATVVIAETSAVLCVFRARHMGVRAARECISFPHRKSDGQSEQVTQVVTDDAQAVTRDTRTGAASPEHRLHAGRNQPHRFTR
ncbi:hypothetical protein SHKM778_48590 [Streptomyces sp. KM77-8]|uniref:Uncharacterized protein n=1 Tax=Streptomyces haneummycinicus TaxID=3074435 RepID=A0AAT9HMB3_9ACTN